MHFDDVYHSELEERIFQEAWKAKEEGTKIVGVYCSFTPKELIAAAGAIPVSLCAGSRKPLERAEQHLPRLLCPLIKSSYGHALSDTCPYFHSADYLVADATCDGKKKMFELLGRVKPVHVLNLPQTSSGEASLAYWIEELKSLVSLLERITGVKLSIERLREEILIYNRYREKIRQVYERNTGPAPLVTGREIAVITANSMYDCNLPSRIREIDDALDMLNRRALDKSFFEAMLLRPRVLLTGCPVVNKKVLNLLEDSGAVVVAQENCGGLKTLSYPVGESEDPLRALAKRYLEIPCSCMTPNHRRLSLIGDIMQRYCVDAVVELTWEACHTYNVESFFVRDFVREKKGVPYLQIRTDFAENDTGQISTRIEAFLEILVRREGGYEGRRMLAS